ncbi:MAG: hypothetical protein HY329_18970 [Chloroflexi bacterium]|nr:hypothetical protein [Chloroflexota bacterium]
MPLWELAPGGVDGSFKGALVRGDPHATALRSTAATSAPASPILGRRELGVWEASVS